MLVNREVLRPRFTEAEAREASGEWGMNCGPAALAAMCGLTLDEARRELEGFDRKRYTNPKMMFRALDRVCAKWSKTSDGAWPEYGLVRVQWHGPWMGKGVPVSARYRHTHWIGSAVHSKGRGVFDVNCMNNGSGWVSLEEWSISVVPWLLGQCELQADGIWSVTHGVETGESDHDLARCMEGEQ